MKINIQKVCLGIGREILEKSVFRDTTKYFLYDSINIQKCVEGKFKKILEKSVFRDTTKFYFFFI